MKFLIKSEYQTMSNLLQSHQFPWLVDLDSNIDSLFESSINDKSILEVEDFLVTDQSFMEKNQQENYYLAIMLLNAFFFNTNQLLEFIIIQRINKCDSLLPRLPSLIVASFLMLVQWE